MSANFKGLHALKYVHTSGTRVCAPNKHKNRLFRLVCLLGATEQLLWTILRRMSCLALKMDVLALCGTIWSLKKQLKKSKKSPRMMKWMSEKSIFFNFFSNFKLHHRTLGTSIFSARRLIRCKMVYSFWFWFKHGVRRYFHPCGTQEAHQPKKSVFVAVGCT